MNEDFDPYIVWYRNYATLVGRPMWAGWTYHTRHKTKCGTVAKFQVHRWPSYGAGTVAKFQVHRWPSYGAGTVAKFQVHRWPSYGAVTTCNIIRICRLCEKKERSTSQASLCKLTCKNINLLTPNVNYSSHTTPLTSKVAFYIFIQQI